MRFDEAVGAGLTVEEGAGHAVPEAASSCSHCALSNGVMLRRDANDRRRRRVPGALASSRSTRLRPSTAQNAVMVAMAPSSVAVTICRTVGADEVAVGMESDG